MVEYLPSIGVHFQVSAHVVEPPVIKVEVDGGWAPDQQNSGGFTGIP